MLLHDLGDPAGGSAWRAVAPPDWVIPDLPGHGSTPAVRTGHYDPMSVVAIARWTLARALETGVSTLVGVGENAHTALVVAAGGACDRVAVLDGLCGPWRTPAEQIDALYDMIRAVVSDPRATAPAPAAGLDPRATYGYGVMSSAHFAEFHWAAIDQPVLAIETPRSLTPRDERAERLAWFGGPATLVELDTADPSSVVDAITAWR
jgi:hypothetical protein